jgi:hypothetical protein
MGINSRIYLLITICFFIITYSNGQSHTFCNIKNSTTQDGETLTYSVYYSFAGVEVKAAVVTFRNQLSIYNNRPVYHFIGDGGTLKSYDWFYKVYDVYESFVDTTTMLPLKFKRDIKEGKNRIFNQALFNHESGNVVTNSSVFKMPTCTQDVLSAIYYARNIDFSNYKVNDKIPFNFYLDDAVYPIYLRYLGKASIKTPKGKYNCIKFSPLLIEGTIFTGGEDMVVYVNDDDNKIPIYIETQILVGKIKVYLTHTEHLRSPKK